MAVGTGPAPIPPLSLLCPARASARQAGSRRHWPPRQGDGRPAAWLSRTAARAQGGRRPSGARVARPRGTRKAARGGAMARAAARGVPRRWGRTGDTAGRATARGPRRPCGSRRRRASAHTGPPRWAPAVARGDGLRRRCSGRSGAKRRREWAAARPGVLGGPRARGSGAQGGAGRSGGVRGRRAARSAAARLRFDGGGADSGGE